MANIRTIRRRIRGAQSTAKITRAMEMVAASKMRRAQERGVGGRPYAEKIRQVIADLAALALMDDTLHPLLQVRPVCKIAVVHITPDRGLCGGLPSNVNRTASAFILEQAAPASIVAVGRKGIDYMTRNGQDMRAVFRNLGDQPRLVDTTPISHIITEDYQNGLIDRVYISYTRFISTVNQKPVIEQILPVQPEPGSRPTDFIFEPSPEAVLGNLLERFVDMQVYHAILESLASEQSARMVAMKNATDSANDLIQDLTLKYNKARQEMITRELIDIIAGQ
jgi:F-type H+-transporting ATPase subunit gamma